MQNTQNVNWWLEILKIAVPSVIALVVPFIAGYLLLKRTENYKKELSKEIEDYKKDISRDLENYKFQLQSGFQTQFYQFQTKFSALHQEQAKVIKELFALLVDINKTIFSVDNKQGLFKGGNLQLFDLDENKIVELQLKQFTNLVDSFDKLNNFYKKNRIFLNHDICESIDKIIESSANLMAVRFVGDLLEKRLKDEHKQNFRKEDYEKAVKEFTSVSSDDISIAINQLENEFRNLIYVEIPNQDKTQPTK